MKQQKHQLVPEFEFTRIGIDFYFDNLKAHWKFANDNLKSEEQRFEEYTKKAIEGLSEEQKEEFYEFSENEFFHINDLFPSLQWMSTFLLAYGVFETTLNKICLLAHRTSNSTLSLNDIKGQGIERAKTYLSKVCRATAPFNTPDWQKIIALSKIRNVLAHSSGDLDLDIKKHQEVFNESKTDKTIQITNHDEMLNIASIQLTAEFVFRAIETFHSFLNTVCRTNVD